MKTVEECYDVIVVGAGHAGCEAALAAARLGCETIIFTVSMNSVALMPCNPNIGGSSKGHLVKEMMCIRDRYYEQKFYVHQGKLRSVYYFQYLKVHLSSIYYFHYPIRKKLSV